MKQENISDCGAVCLLYLIKHYKGKNNIDNIRMLTKCNKYGVTAYNLIKAAEKLGFKAEGYKLTLEQLKNSNEFPAILHVIINNKYKHYVILEGFKNEKIIVKDFLYGTKKYSYDDFLKIWTNIVIFIKPIRKLDVINTKNEFYKKLFKINYKEYIKILAISFLIIILSLINAFYLKLLIDKSYKNIFMLFTIVILFKSLIEYIRNKSLIKFDQKIEKNLFFYFYNKLISLPNHFFNTKQKGEFINIIYDIFYIQELYSKVFIVIFIDISLLIFISILISFISLKLFIYFILLNLIYIIIYLMFSRKIHSDILNIQNTKGEVFSFVTETINNINSIKNLNIEQIIFKNFKNYNKNYILMKSDFSKKYNKINIIKDIVLLININLILCFGNNMLSVSNLILFNTLAINFLETLRNIFDLELNIKNGLSAIRRISFIFSNIKEEGININNINTIEFKNLNFGYSDLILNNINLKIKKNDKIFIKGNSGVGKSTLFNILIKNIEINNNMAFINDVDINNIKKNSILNHISYVTSNEVIFNDTLYNNIVLNKEVSKSKFKKICNMFYVTEIMKNKKINYNDLVLENGNDFSLGERQRIILARTFLMNKEVIILDECLTNIDYSLEKKIIKRFLKNYDNTIIFISHKDNDLFPKKIKINKKGVEHETKQL